MLSSINKLMMENIFLYIQGTGIEDCTGTSA